MDFSVTILDFIGKYEVLFKSEIIVDFFEASL